MGDIRIGDLVVIDIPLEKRITRDALHGKAGIVVGVTGCVYEKEVYAKFDIRLNLTNRIAKIPKDLVLLKATPEQHPELFI